MVSLIGGSDAFANWLPSTPAPPVQSYTPDTGYVEPTPPPVITNPDTGDTTTLDHTLLEDIENLKTTKQDKLLSTDVEVEAAIDNKQDKLLSTNIAVEAAIENRYTKAFVDDFLNAKLDKNDAMEYFKDNVSKSPGNRFFTGLIELQLQQGLYLEDSMHFFTTTGWRSLTVEQIHFYLQFVQDHYEDLDEIAANKALIETAMNNTDQLLVAPQIHDTSPAHDLAGKFERGLNIRFNRNLTRAIGETGSVNALEYCDSIQMSTWHDFTGGGVNQINISKLGNIRMILKRADYDNNNTPYGSASRGQYAEALLKDKDNILEDSYLKIDCKEVKATTLQGDGSKITGLATLISEQVGMYTTTSDSINVETLIDDRVGRHNIQADIGGIYPGYSWLNHPNEQILVSGGTRDDMTYSHNTNIRGWIRKIHARRTATGGIPQYALPRPPSHVTYYASQLKDDALSDITFAFSWFRMDGYYQLSEHDHYATHYDIVMIRYLYDSFNSEIIYTKPDAGGPGGECRILRGVNRNDYGWSSSTNKFEDFTKIEEAWNHTDVDYIYLCKFNETSGLFEPDLYEADERHHAESFGINNFRHVVSNDLVTYNRIKEDFKIDDESKLMPEDSVPLTGDKFTAAASPVPLAYVNTLGRINSATLYDNIFSEQVFGIDDPDTGPNRKPSRYLQGLVPSSDSLSSSDRETHYLRADGSWSSIDLTTINDNIANKQDKTEGLSLFVNNLSKISYALYLLKAWNLTAWNIELDLHLSGSTFGMQTAGGAKTYTLDELSNSIEFVKDYGDTGTNLLNSLSTKQDKTDALTLLVDNLTTHSTNLYVVKASNLTDLNIELDLFLSGSYLGMNTGSGAKIYTLTDFSNSIQFVKDYGDTGTNLLNSLSTKQDKTDALTLLVDNLTTSSNNLYVVKASNLTDLNIELDLFLSGSYLGMNTGSGAKIYTMTDFSNSIEFVKDIGLTASNLLNRLPPAYTTGTTKFLREDGSYQEITIPNISSGVLVENQSDYFFNIEVDGGSGSSQPTTGINFIVNDGSPTNPTKTEPTYTAFQLQSGWESGEHAWKDAYLKVKGHSATSALTTTILCKQNKVSINPSNDSIAPSETLDVNGNCKAIKFIGDGSELTGIPKFNSITESNRFCITSTVDGGTISYISPTSDLISEGTTNKYYTDAKVDSRITTRLNSGEITNIVSQQIQAQQVVANSDIRLKENIKLLKNSNLENFIPVEYNFKSDKFKRRRFGLIAQDVEEYCPELVYTGEDSYKGVNYQDIIALLIKENKDLKQTVNTLIHKTNNLEKKIEKILSSYKL